MSTTKRYLITQEQIADEAGPENEVVLEVDHSKLTTDSAKRQVESWSGAITDRAGTERDTLAVLRLFASDVVRLMVAAGGCKCADDEQAAAYSREQQSADGWGGADDTPFGTIGIRVVRAYVAAPGGCECGDPDCLAGSQTFAPD